MESSPKFSLLSFIDLMWNFLFIIEEIPNVCINKVNKIKAVTVKFSVFLIILQGIFEANEFHLELSICPLHRDDFGVRWLSNKKTCAMPPGWAPHKDIPRKGDRGLTVAQSKRLYQITSIFVPVSSRKYEFIFC